MPRTQKFCYRTVLVVTSLLVAPLGANCQESAAKETHPETEQELVAQLTSTQRQQFDLARKQQLAKHYAEASPVFRELLQEHPGDSVLIKWSSDAALEQGDSAYALGLLKPLVQTNYEDWQAASMLARAAAESGDKPDRDASMMLMKMLQSHQMTPPTMQQYVLERIVTGKNVITTHCFLVPWGPYRIYYLADVANASGETFLRISLESGDGDQAPFAKEHAKEAAAGVRAFTMDAYLNTGVNPSGQQTQTHFTYKFYVGEPSYDTVREEFMNIANGKTSPVSSRTGLIVPQ